MGEQTPRDGESATPTCGQAVTTGNPMGVRYVGRCGRPVVEDGKCRDHAAIARAMRRRFQETMDRASRHFRGVRFRPQGSKVRASGCSGCQATVLDGEDHPWGVPAKEEQEWWDEHPFAPHRPSWIEDPKVENAKRFVICGDDLTVEEREAVHAFMAHMAGERRAGATGSNAQPVPAELEDTIDGQPCIRCGDRIERSALAQFCRSAPDRGPHEWAEPVEYEPAIDGVRQGSSLHVGTCPLSDPSPWAKGSPCFCKVREVPTQEDSP